MTEPPRPPADGDDLDTLVGVTRSLFDDASAFVGLVGPDESLVYANPAAREVIDETPAELYGRQFPETGWWTDDETRGDRIRENLAAALDGNRRTFPTTHPRTDGGEVEVRVELNPVYGPDVDADGDAPVTAVVVIGYDVTERTELASAHAATTEALEGLYRVAADAGLDLDEAVRRLLAVGRERLGLGEAFLSRIDDDTQVVEVSLTDRLELDDGSQLSLSTSYCKYTLASDDGVFDVNGDGDEAVADAVRAEHAFSCYVGAEITVDDAVYGTICFSDLDPRGEPFGEAERTFVQLLAQWLGYELERRGRERRLERQNERLEEFADMVTHDLRAPLNVAGGRADLAREALAGLPAEDDAAALTDARESLAEASDALDRMETMISELRTLAEEGKVVGTPTLTPLRDVIERAASSSLPADATLSVEVPRGTEVVADAERLRTLFENLFSNVGTHAGTGVAVTVGVTDDAPSDSGFYVADDGTGFAGPRRDVFEEGFTTSSDGTGYGLSIVESIATAHGWSITASDSDAGGARFEVHDVSLEPRLDG